MRPLLAVSTAVSIALSAAACGGTAGSARGRMDRGDAVVPAVEVVQARSGAVPLRARATGTVRASGEVAIYPQASGSVIEVLAQNGDAVTKGDVLVRIQAAGARPQVTQARSALQAARARLNEADARYRELAAEYERNRSLGSRGLVPQNTVESLRAQTEAARAAVASARAQVQQAEGSVAERQEVAAQSVVRAPITGRVGQRNVEVGMRVDPQTALFIIGRLDNMRVEAPVTQEVLTRVRRGQRVELRVGGRLAPIESRVSRISPFLRPGSFSAEVEIDVPNESAGLVPGMFVTVDIFYGESEQATLVPTSAVYEEAASGTRGVYIAASAPPPAPAGADADPDRRPPPVAMEFRQVDIVAEADQTVGVAGVEPGDWVVVVGQHLLAAQSGSPQARPRAISWERIMELQQLQRHDLLKDFLERQRRGRGEG